MSYLGQSRSWGRGVFGQFPLRDRLVKQIEELKAAVDRHDADDLLARPTDDLVGEYMELFDLDPPVIHWDEAEQLEPEETEVEVPADFRYSRIDGRPSTRVVKATRVIITVPISGTTELLGAEGRSTLLREWDNSSIRNGELALWKEWPNPTEESVSAWWEREKSEIERQVGPVRSELAAWRERLPGVVRELIEQRRARLLRNRGLEGALGLPVRRRNQPPRPVPVRRKKVATTRARRQAKSQPFEPEPVLPEQTYLEIIDIICAFGRGLERSPKVAQKYDEEELRDQVLIQLNGHYEGEAGGELFNGEGKTDILVRQDDRNVFIGECKFWDGQKKLTEALDQLARYMVWRDTKAAIVLFIKQRDPSATIEKAKAAIRSHPTYKRDGGRSSDPESYTNFVLRHGDDDQREVHLALIPVVVREE